MELPLLSDQPLRHPKCCLSLSQPLLDTLARVLQEHLGPRGGGLVLSVGCGTGLLEELLHGRVAGGGGGGELRVEGVEVAAAGGGGGGSGGAGGAGGADAEGRLAYCSTSYLPEDRANTVPGTWALSRRAADAAALLFVYPRSEGLVRRYAEEARAVGEGATARLVVWLGPATDWETFRGALEGGGGGLRTLSIAVGRECGVSEYEMMAVLKAE